MDPRYSTAEFEEKYTYRGNDLGAAWSEQKTCFRLWAPTAQAVWVNLYRTGTPEAGEDRETLPMNRAEQGTWTAERAGDLNGRYYTFSVTVENRTEEVCDPYARTTGINGIRAMVLDLRTTDPEGWDTDTDPHAGNAVTDNVIYELHLRDLSADRSSGIVHAGKFLGLTEHGTRNRRGFPTGLDYICQLGITHLHLMPCFDFGSVDEAAPDGDAYNWGYDPVNFNVPEGSYSTDPSRGQVRVAEMKQMVRALHSSGISVVMDVVYNHVYDREKFCFNRIVPDYFSRVSRDGAVSNGSGCGNDTASERSMVRKYLVDSVCYWADEYHIDGFRFDLVGLLDVDTVNEIVRTVHKNHPNVMFYGEGWTMETAATKDGCLMATQRNSILTPGFAYFSDTLRDGLRGSVFDDNATGYVSGAQGLESVIRACFLGCPGWCQDPVQTVNYASCHDNMTLFDRLTQSASGVSEEKRIRMNRLAAALCLLSQGIPFFQAGEEILRTKPLPEGGFDSNSYRSSDRVNSLKWDMLSRKKYREVSHYYQGLIAFRKAHPVLRLTTAEAVAEQVRPVENTGENVLAFELHDSQRREKLFAVFNANHRKIWITLPEGTWTVFVSGKKAGTEPQRRCSGGVAVPLISAMVLVQKTGDGETVCPD